VLCLVKHSLVKKKKMNCKMLSCDATASSFVAKVRGEHLAHFHAVATKENDEHALDFNLHLSHLFWSR
jgi:hypothetical protein